MQIQDLSQRFIYFGQSCLDYFSVIVYLIAFWVSKSVGFALLIYSVLNKYNPECHSIFYQVLSNLTKTILQIEY